MKFAALASLCLAGCVAAKAIRKPLSADAQLKRRDYSQNVTDNQLIDGTECRDITIIFAKGTFEPGNVGAVVGPQFFTTVVNYTSESQVAVQGVNYTNDVAGFLAGGDRNGSILMAQYATQAVYQCPDTNLVLSGYSQGAQLVHNAAALLDDCVTDFISSVILFGDPKEGQPVGNISADRVLSICHPADTICHGGYIITESHLNYSNDAGTAAQFIVDHAVLY